MRIVVIGVYYASNLGDAVICDCVAHWLKEKWPLSEIDVIDIENKQCFEKQEDTSLRLLEYRRRKLQWDYFLTKHKIRDRVYYWNQLDVETRQSFYDQIAEKKYDAAVFAGGQLFMDWLSVDLTEFLRRFEKVGTPVYFNACGTGLAVSEKIRSLLSRYLQNSNVKLISTRDDKEQIERCYLGGKRTAVKTYDPALWAAQVYGVSKNSSSQVIGLGVMYSNHAPLWKITRFWLRLIKMLDEKKIPWKMFCNGAIDDYNYAAYLLEKAGKKKESYLYDYPENPEELIRQITSFRSLISFRLHSHIIATSFQIPAIAVVWDEKLRFFYRNLEHEERCKTISDSADSVLKALKKAEEEGYDWNLIEKQKNFSRELLVGTLQEEEQIG
ncbi:MAG: polysaccharide pyruvyl transferase family protein [Fusicatenibacter sp.]|nr:polysaccharide pyruvyl transferase family protein [Lachnospiraceae bacterium]MDY2936705.1 polysaccharide pyruvyl transferase family protein [Fusicatenibacter sp.]